jgi:hypothetical protein
MMTLNLFKKEENLSKLLINEETKVPATVATVARFFDEMGIWHQCSRNLPAMSCQDSSMG